MNQTLNYSYHLHALSLSFSLSQRYCNERWIFLIFLICLLIHLHSLSVIAMDSGFFYFFQFISCFLYTHTHAVNAIAMDGVELGMQGGERSGPLRGVLRKSSSDPVLGSH